MLNSSRCVIPAEHPLGGTPAPSEDFPMPSRRPDETANSRGVARRDLLKIPAALAAGSLLGGARRARAALAGGVTLAPNYYPLAAYVPQIDLSGKLAVITGASRGIGRAVGEALAPLGVAVIGTSRHPKQVPNPPAFPLLKLDISEPPSVAKFVEELQHHPLFRYRGQVDILGNNAGRLVLGPIVPRSSQLFDNYVDQRTLGVNTVYFGHVVVTNSVLPLMSQQGYSRIVFTASSNSYTSFSRLTFENLAVGSSFDVYCSCKSALRFYANNLDNAFRVAGSSIRVSTVNPYAIGTAIAEHPHPIYTEPVNQVGLSATDQVFNEFLTVIRQFQANGLPPAMVGQTYAQLLTMANPDQNVVVASPLEPLATKGGNAVIEPAMLAENQVSAIPFTCS
jgi:NAD(P)-dependent dehydrogenase (short-subunit alcohol dehydrogenase family)